MGAVVSFDYAAWQAEFPEFSAITEARATGLFNRATMLHANDGSGPVINPAMQAGLLNLVVSHLAAIYVQSQSDPAPGQAKDASTPAGRISSASQGSVSAQFDMGITATASKAYWQQTRYGVEYWRATGPYRKMRYVLGNLNNGTVPRPPYLFRRW